MSIQEVLEVIKAFFAAITKIFESLGIFGKKEEGTTAADETTEA